ncbi:hypothetical protein ACH5RR_005798 [Cinchona calisaya]|uniref:Uncharacterized protein n=1 Tax=Cinchona calisaya TaxID=153742 RepID=A0ABD3AM55_9GENT
MAFAWVRTKNLLRNYFDHGEIIIGMTMTRFTRDIDVQLHRSAPPRAVAIVLGTIDVVVAVVFVIAALIIVLMTSTEESPPKPLRFWIGVYAIQCIVHLAWLCIQRCRRQEWERFFRNNVNVSLSTVEYAKEIICFYVGGLWDAIGYCKAAEPGPGRESLLLRLLGNN